MLCKKFVILALMTLLGACNLRTSESNTQLVTTPTLTSTVLVTSTKIPTATYTATISPPSPSSTPIPPTHIPEPTPPSVLTDTIQMRLNDEGDFDFSRVWSPDNTQVAFVSDRGIYVMNVDGTNKIFLTEGENPIWSPDGQRIAFASKDDGDYEIYIINIDGTNQTPITNNEISDGFPAWSPNGKKIAFVSDRDSPNFPDAEKAHDIYVMNPDGTDQTRLTYTAANWPGSGSGSPDWSPDSKYVIFHRFMGFGNYDIYIIKADGTEQKRLTETDTTWDLYPKWLPDGQHIVFRSSSISGGGWETYVMNADGSDIRPLRDLSSK